ncbi:MAG: hypothetical protein RLY31_1543 [Bacteroidota bacterium]|jgi:8-oxo-dGTP pyrophosphatase MutT (NUDIX family)
MYKIYVNNTPVRLVRTTEIAEVGSLGDKKLLLRYPGKRKYLLNVADMLEKSSRLEEVVIYHGDLAALWDDFRTGYQSVSAAGGVVFHEEEVLMIYRKGFWDLPKGKVDPGETPQEAAVREVLEETGVLAEAVLDSIPDTWHTYRQHGKRMLKRTYWFRMVTRQRALTLQEEEDITGGEWVDQATARRLEPGMYGSIRDVMRAAWIGRVNGDGQK